MKTTLRSLLGIVSSLLLSAGLSHAAQRLDPVSIGLRGMPTSLITNDDPPMPCAYVPLNAMQNEAS